MVTVNGTPNDDNLIVPVGVSGETLMGLGGNDILDGGFAVGNNILIGGDGNDQLFANKNDQLFGGTGDDILDAGGGLGGNTLSGEDGNDTIFASVNDIVDGGNGNDVIFAGLGGNTLSGGLGKDVFWIAVTDIPNSPNTIADFNPVSDTIRVKLAEVTQLSDLTFTQSGADAIISLTAGGKQQLAIVKNTLISNLNSTTVAVADSTPNNPTVNQAPTITAATFSIDENSVFNTLIGQVVANDPNTGDKITFGIASGNTDVNGNGKTPFAIDPTTGEIRVNDPSDLSFDINPTFNLIATATDLEGATSQATVTVNLKNVVEPITFNKENGSFDVFSLAKGEKANPSLQFTVNSNSNNQISELGVFTVDDTNGNIDGVAPDQSGYAAKALARASVVFSVIDNNPNGFSENGLSHLLQYDNSVRLRFYTINDRSITTDSVVKNGSFDKVNISPSSTTNITQLSDSSYSIKFNNIDINVKPSEDQLPIGTKQQDKTEGEVLDLSQGFDTKAFPQVKADFIVNREAAFDDFVGFYKIENAKGDIKKSDGTIVSVGQSGYVQAAVGGQISGIDLNVANQSTQTTSGVFNSGSIFAPFIIVNGTRDRTLDNNPFNDPAVYFPFLGANTDKVDHVRLLANNTFGFEDLPRGGDFDYNDIIVKVKLTPIA